MSKKKKHNSNIRCLIQVLEALCDDVCPCEKHSIEGCITLNQGNHEITIACDTIPERVFLSVTPLGTPVCVGAIDLVGYTLIPDGFVLYAEIKSAAAEVCYVA